jgi:hypothetical protein
LKNLPAPPFGAPQELPAARRAQRQKPAPRTPALPAGPSIFIPRRQPKQPLVPAPQISSPPSADPVPVITPTISIPSTPSTAPSNPEVKDAGISRPPFFQRDPAPVVAFPTTSPPLFEFHKYSKAQLDALVARFRLVEQMHDHVPREELERQVQRSRPFEEVEGDGNCALYAAIRCERQFKGNSVFFPNPDIQPSLRIIVARFIDILLQYDAPFNTTLGSEGTVARVVEDDEIPHYDKFICAENNNRSKALFYSKNKVWVGLLNVAVLAFLCQRNVLAFIDDKAKNKKQRKGRINFQLGGIYVFDDSWPTWRIYWNADHYAAIIPQPITDHDHNFVASKYELKLMENAKIFSENFSAAYDKKIPQVYAIMPDEEHTDNEDESPPDPNIVEEQKT